jgi:hypothetical protein
VRLRVGPGESGKSTIFKQMKIISMAGGFTREELMAYKHVIYGNCVTQMKVIVHAASKLGIEMASEDNAVRVSSSSPLLQPSISDLGHSIAIQCQIWITVSATHDESSITYHCMALVCGGRVSSQERAERLAKLPAGGDSFTPQVAQDIAALWADAGIRAAYEQRDKAYQLNDSAS